MCKTLQWNNLSAIPALGEDSVKIVATRSDGKIISVEQKLYKNQTSVEVITIFRALITQLEEKRNEKEALSVNKQ